MLTSSLEKFNFRLRALCLEDSCFNKKNSPLNRHKSIVDEIFNVQAKSGLSALSKCVKIYLQSAGIRLLGSTQSIAFNIAKYCRKDPIIELQTQVFLSSVRDSVPRLINCVLYHRLLGSRAVIRTRPLPCKYFEDDMLLLKTGLHDYPYKNYQKYTYLRDSYSIRYTSIRMLFFQRPPVPSVRIIRPMFRADVFHKNFSDAISRDENGVWKVLVLLDEVTLLVLGPHAP